MTKSQQAGLMIAVLTLVAAALVIPEVRIFFRLQEPHKVTTPEERSPKFVLVEPLQFEAEKILKWRPNGRLGIPFSVVVRNVGGSMSANSQVRISSSTLDHEQKRYSKVDNGYTHQDYDQKFNGLAPGEGREVYFVYWMDEEIKSPPIGKHPFKLVIFSGSDGSVRSELTFTISVGKDLTIKEHG